MSICGKERGQSPVYMCISTCTLGMHMYTRGVWGHASLDFRRSETASGVFSGTL